MLILLCLALAVGIYYKKHKDAQSIEQKDTSIASLAKQHQLAMQMHNALKEKVKPKESNASKKTSEVKKEKPAYRPAIIEVQYKYPFSLKTDANKTELKKPLLKTSLNLSGKSKLLVSKPEAKNSTKPYKDLKKASFILTYKPGKRPKITLNSRPKLIIIIDDLALKNQVKMVKETNLKLNPSFLPPTKEHPNSAKLAKGFPFFIVHLPMQALHYNAPEPNTLLAHDKKATILKRLQTIKKQFKGVRFINNHTGSRFTSNTQAMKKLYEAMDKEGLFFIDSRTIGNTKSPRLARIYGLPYVSRDIFLDNKDDKAYIKGQIKKLLRLAKKRGFAIAIGHPRLKTMQALKESAALFKDYELCYLSEFFKGFKGLNSTKRSL